MKFDGGEIGYPNQAGEIVGQNIIDVSLIALAPDGNCLHPVGPVLGGVLLEETFLVNTPGVALEGQGMVGKVRQEHRPDAGVVVNDLAFGKAGGGIENLVKVGQAEVF